MTQMTRRGLFAAVVAALWRPRKPLIVAPAVPIGRLWERFTYQNKRTFRWPELPKHSGSTIKMYRFKEIA